MPKCRVCTEEILQDNKYCPYCGWLNGSIEIMDSKIWFSKPLNIGDEANVIELIDNIVIKHIGTAPVQAKLAIEDNSFFYFEDGSQQFSKEIVEDFKLPVSLKLGSPDDYDKIKNFILYIETNDGIPIDNSMPAKNRPYTKEYINKHDPIRVEVLLTKPVKLQFDHNFIVFNKFHKSAKITIKNEGNNDIKIIKIDHDKNIEFDKISTIPKSASVIIEIKYNGQNLPNKRLLNAEVFYEIGSSIFSEKIHFFLCGKKDNSGVRPDNIVAIDFGTSKITGAYLNLRNKESEIKNIEKDNKEIPSCMAYEREGKCFIGIEAQARKRTEEYVERIKTHLRDENTITFSYRSRSPANDEDIHKKDITKVVTDFFRTFKNKYLLDVLENDDGFEANNMYIFTLPILDDSEDGNGELYERQKQVTLACAKEVFFSEDSEEGDINTLKESEAAMFFIVDIILNNINNKLKNINLTPGRTICIFDYGAGTLDISFGTFFIDDNDKPNLENIANIGLFTKNGDTKAKALGGDDIDKNMLKKFAADNNIIFVEDETFGKIVTDGSNAYEEVSHDSLNLAIRDVKINLSKNWNNPDCAKVVVDPTPYQTDYAGEKLEFKKDVFTKIIDEDIEAAIKAMRKIMDEKNIVRLDYIFLVGGSSLLKEIKEKMVSEFGNKVYSPYDYGCDDTEDENDDEVYEKIKHMAVHAVAQGAVLSYKTRFENTLNFDIEIRTGDNEHGNKKLLKFEKGNPIPIHTRERLYSLDDSENTFSIIAKINNHEYILDRVIIDSSKIDNTDIFIRASIDNKRKLYFEFKYSKEEEYKPLNEFDVIV